MSTVIITCQTIQREVNLAISETGVDYPILLVDSGLHNFPDQLGKAIQDQIDKVDNTDTILMAFGFCGNGLLGIKARKARLIIPRADDCITLMLGSYEVRKKVQKEVGTYFLTKGWLEYERNIISEYEGCVLRYGQARALRVMKIMLNHYRRLMVIDTKAYQLDEILNKTESFAAAMGMQHEQYVGSMRFLNKLLAGPWGPEEFIILEPGRELAFADMRIDNYSIESSQFLSGFNS
ncbi:MAG: DUF1638 domain-containing protein [Thermincola sp.]|nr:DUF1638 domain-containing protein [Thermincola sp.]MDT3702504.1 DUF1638 domain-containing protein [Thermincola sp.]